MRKKPVSVVIVDEPEGRYVVSTFADGEVTRTFVDPKKKPTRRPRKPIARARVKDHTRRKRF